MRGERPREWADAVEFDRLIRNGGARASANSHPLRGHAYLHRSRVPLDQAPIDRRTRTELRDAQGDLFDALADQDIERGCSPFACRGDDHDSAAA
ncbi:hypothetical protein ACFXG4_34220 [Nocardia sp. NPDC059246]|uniref:hypothetical protein n=1 Tax=unclassified Nocardia TaxID=2637762 RepID=UPI0036952BC3